MTFLRKDFGKTRDQLRNHTVPKMSKHMFYQNVTEWEFFVLWSFSKDK